MNAWYISTLVWPFVREINPNRLNGICSLFTQYGLVEVWKASVLILKSSLKKKLLNKPKLIPSTEIKLWVYTCESCCASDQVPDGRLKEYYTIYYIVYIDKLWLLHMIVRHWKCVKINWIAFSCPLETWLLFWRRTNFRCCSAREVCFAAVMLKAANLEGWRV